jgi:hypothetical protein
MTRMARRGASIAVVVKGRGRPYASHVTGIISRITSPILSPKVSDLTQDNGASYDPREPRLSKLHQFWRITSVGLRDGAHGF